LSTNETPLPPAGTNRAPRRGRRIFAAAALLLFTFGAGIIVGIAGDRIALLHDYRVIPRGHARFVSNKVLRVLTRKLDLTPEQQVQVRSILQRHSDAIEKAAASVEPVIHQELKAAHIEIEQVLNPQQKALLRKMHARWKE